MALIACHLGVVNEDEINDMSYLLFEDVLAELGHKLSYEAISGYAGNSFCKDSWDMIQKANPFKADEDRSSGNQAATMSILQEFAKGNVKVIKRKSWKDEGNGKEESHD